MLSGANSETVVWLTDGSKTYCFSEANTNTMTAFGKKTVFTVTVFHDPMPEAVEAVQFRMQQPAVEKRFEVAGRVIGQIRTIFNRFVEVNLNKQKP